MSPEKLAELTPKQRSEYERAKRNLDRRKAELDRRKAWIQEMKAILDRPSPDAKQNLLGKA